MGHKGGVHRVRSCGSCLQGAKSLILSPQIIVRYLLCVRISGGRQRWTQHRFCPQDAHRLIVTSKSKGSHTMGSLGASCVGEGPSASRGIQDSAFCGDRAQRKLPGYDDPPTVPQHRSYPSRQDPVRAVQAKIRRHKRQYKLLGGGQRVPCILCAPTNGLTGFHNH